MDITFLGAATTVTGSQFLLTTDRARILIDCGMFQGSPNESIRNRIPLGFDPKALDAILLTHAHLDHCGLIPHVVDAGYKGPIWATKGTVELAGLVLLDSGKLQEEFARRDERRNHRDAEPAADHERREQAAYEAAIELAEHGEERRVAIEPSTDPAQFGRRRHDVSLAVPGDGGGPSAPATIASDPESALLRQPASLDVDLDEPLYDEASARRALQSFRAVSYGAEIEVAPGIHATFVDAGHILGSAIVCLRVADREGAPERRIVFSGDLGRPGTPILRDPSFVAEADYVIVESTYGGRVHEPEAESTRVLADAVRFVASEGGVLLVPSFAIGRTQEVVWELERLIEQHTIPALPLYLDSPMASKASGIYRSHADYWDQETRALLAGHGSPLDYQNQIVTNDFQASQAIARAKRPYIIVASNGMLTGGRVVGHLRDLISDPKALLLFVGYQGVGTLGDHLQKGAQTVRIDGEVRQVRCQVRSISGFSAHADEPELLGWLGHFGAGRKAGEAGFPRRVFLVHGDPDAQEALLPKVQALGFDTVIPGWRETISLD